MRIGVIADTHGKVLSEVFDAFHGVSLILHAGDIGRDEVIIELEAIARVVAVRGNTDADLGAPWYPDTRRLMLDGVDIFLCHEPSRAANLAEMPDVIVYGHTHTAKNVCEGHTLWFNPGTASRPRFGNTAYTVGILTLAQGTATGEIIHIR